MSLEISWVGSSEGGTAMRVKPLVSTRIEISTNACFSVNSKAPTYHLKTSNTPVRPRINGTSVDSSECVVIGARESELSGIEHFSKVFS